MTTTMQDTAARTARRRWDKRLDSGEPFRHSWAMTLGQYMAGRGTRTNLTWRDLDAIIDRIEREQPTMDRADADRGLTWLRSLAFTAKGEDRKGSPFIGREKDIIRDGTHMTLVGWHYVYQGPHWETYRPIYRVHSPHGTLDYSVETTRSEAMSGAQGEPIRVHRRW